MSETRDLATADAADAEPGERAPLSARDDTYLVAHIKQCLREFDSASSPWAKEARVAYQFVAGDQWSEEDRAALRDASRPEITFNRTGPIVDAVCGAQVNSRLETRFLPRTIEDGGAAEVLSGVLGWVRDGCDAEDEESDAFRDAAIAGIGFIEWRPDYTDDPQGNLVAERCDPFEMAWDCAASRVSLYDARWIARRRLYPEDEALARWPEAVDHLSAERGDVGSTPAGRTSALPVRDGYAREDSATAHTREDGVEVVQYEWCEVSAEIQVLDPLTQQMVRMSLEDWERLGDRVGEEYRKKLRHVSLPKREWWRAIMVGGAIVDRGYTPDPARSSFFAITGKRDQTANQWYGIVRAVIDPQRWANKWLAQGLHILNTSASSGVIAEEGAIADKRAFEETWAKPGAISEVSGGALSGGRFQQKVAAAMPPGMQQLMQFALVSMNDTTGINKEMLGTVDREQAGVLEWQRKQAAQAVIAPLFDAMRRYYKASGRSLLVMVRSYVSPDKALRILGPRQQPQTIQAAMVPDVAQYDIVVDQAPTSPNSKMETWQTLQPLMPMITKMLPPQAILPLLRHSPLPESAVSELEQALNAVMQQQQQQGPPPEVQKMQAELQMKQAEMQMQQQAEQQKAQADMAKAVADIEVMRQKAAMEMQIAQQKAAVDIQIAAMKADAQARATMFRAAQPKPQTVQ